tara:strand:+ start:1032 stop:4934 length:3903 start_codon:yes stop_codon:yes gene_type:complete
MSLFNSIKKYKSILFTATFLLLFSSINANSIELVKVTITLDIKNAPLEKVFSKIELQSGYNFFYENNTIDLNRLITIKVDKEPLNTVLSKIFNEKKITFKVINHQVVLISTPIIIQKGSYTIQGKIIDKVTGEIIPYCSISQVNSYIGTSSNDLGEFEIKTDSLPSQLAFTHVGYHKQTITISNTKEPLVVELKPLANVLDEIVIKTVGVGKNKDRYAINLAKSAYKKIQLDSEKNRNKFARAFYRQKSKNDEKYSEFAEIIYDLKYNTSGIEQWDILQGRYALNEESINNKNYTLFSRILKSFQPQTKDLIFPLHPSLEDYYDITLDDMIAQDESKIAILKFTPKKGIETPIFHGEAYINTSTFDVLKINGTIYKDDLKLVRLNDKDTSKKNYQLSYDIIFKKDSTQKSVIDYIKIDQEFDYYKEEKLITHMSATSNLTFFEYYNPTSRKKLGRQFRRKDSDWDKLNKVGYNKEFWENNPIVKRTPMEKDVIDAFEKQDAFGSIFLNSREQITLIQSKLHKDKLVKKFDTLLGYYNYYNPVEKVYLHTDKNKVDIGGELWYSAYTVIGPAHYYSSASKFLHVNIVDSENDVIFSQRVKIVKGKSKGYIKIPDNIIPGKYQLRAYTDWMRNYDLNFIFKKTITISNGYDSQINAASNNIDLQFFPEGGNSIHGLTGRVAFKAIGSDGLARIVKGKIIDSKGNEIKQLKSNDQGVGYFNLKPNLGEQYSAVLRDGSKYPLPEVFDQGYSMFINNMNQKSIQVRVQASNNLKNEPFYLIGTVGNQKYFQGKYNLKGKSFANIEIPKNMLPSGVATITLFDENMRPWSERIVFVDNQQELIINTELNKNDLIKKGEVTVKINVTDPEGKPVSTNLSIAVTNQSNRVKKDANDSNILTHLLLESDLKGHIEKPAQFFHNKSRMTKYNLDLIMLTNGWRRFNWEKMKSYDFDTIKKFSFPDGFSISGIAKRKNRKILENTSLHLIVKSKEKERFYATRTRPDGSFTFDNVDHMGVTEIQFKAYNSRPIDVEITLDNINPIGLTPLFPSLYKIVQTRNTTNTSATPITNSKGKTTLLSEVVIKGKIDKTKSERKITSQTTFGVEPDARVFVDKPYYDFLQVLNKVPGIQIAGESSSTIVTIRGGGSPLWVIDGVPVADENHSGSLLNAAGTVPSALFNLSSLDIERIDVLKGPKAAIYGSRGASGVILIYTSRGVNSDLQSVSTPKFKISAFAEVKQFYTPKYEVDVNQNDNTTLYWNPLITTDKNGNATINFYNMTNAKKIQIAIEALSLYGVPGAYLKTFEGEK